MSDRNRIDIPHFKHWLRQQDPETFYQYTAASDCLVARYMKAHGFTHVDGGPWEGKGVRADGVLVYFDIPRPLENAALNGGTYGGALALLP